MPTDQGVRTPLPPGAFARLAAPRATRSSASRRPAGSVRSSRLRPWRRRRSRAGSSTIRSASTSTMSRGRTAAIVFRRVARARRRAAAAAHRDRDAQGPDRGGLSDPVRRPRPATPPPPPPRIAAALAFLARPDRRHSFAAWLRMLLEDMLVIDAATHLSALHPRRRALQPRRHRRRRRSRRWSARTAARPSRPTPPISRSCTACRPPTSPPTN